MDDDATPTRISIVIADDHAIVRSALRARLEAEPDLEVVAEAGDADEAARKVLAYKPSVLVLDLSMPGTPSLQLIPRIREISPATETVVLTMEDEPQFAREAMRSGALAFVLKESADDELVAAVHAVVNGERYLNPQLGGLIAAMPEQPAGPPDGLSEREARGAAAGRPWAHQRRDLRPAVLERADGRITPGPHPAEGWDQQPG